VVISNESFDRGDLLPTAEVFAFLRRDTEHAYTAQQIHRALVTEFGFTFEQVREALDALVARGQVESKQIDWERYYRFRQRRMGFPLPGRQ